MLKSFVLSTFLPIFNFGNRAYHWGLSMVDRLSEVFSILFQPSFYVFFEGNITPYPLRKVNTWASGSAAPEFLYCEDTKTFIPWLPGSSTTDETIYKYGGLDEMKLKCLPILSMELVDEYGDVVYDVTDFLESVRFCEAPGLPTPNLFHIMAAWSISSHIVPNYDKYIVRYINGDGDVKTMSPDMSGESEEVSSGGSSEDASITAAETPAVEQPAVETPAVEQPAAETPALEQPAAETPALEQPVVETSAVEQPVVETSAVEQPVAETPAVEQPQEATTEQPATAPQT